jgi:mono/diheme cytochrome c family protein
MMFAELTKGEIMITKIAKWIGILLGSLIVLAAILGSVLVSKGNARLAKKYEVQIEAVAIPTDQESIERGRKWAAVLCADCHGMDYSGKLLIDDPVIGFLPASNLTSGQGGMASEFTDADWIQVLRHGIDPREGRALIAMPSMNYYYLTDKDLGEVIAYMKTIPSMDHDLGEPKMSFMGKILLSAGAFGKDILPAESINHDGQHPAVIAPDVTVEYGGYLVRVTGCRDCHGQDLTGGKSPEPGAPPAPGITSSGVVGAWPKETFINQVRTLDGTGMPWLMLKPLNDAELEAIFLYLQSQP